MLHDYIGVVVIFIFSLALSGAMIYLGSILGPKKPNSAKDLPYECGVDLLTNPGHRKLQVHFYLIAMIFIVFDVELMFLFPWAVLFRELGWMGLVHVSIFIFFILLAYIYAWKKRALEVE